MIDYNIFIVSSPLQLMNAIEARYYFKTSNNILLILYTDNNKALSQIKKLQDFMDWNIIKYIPLPQIGINKILFVFVIHNLLKEIRKESIDKIFVGDYQSEHINHIVNYFDNKNIYLLDDGMAVTHYNEYKFKKSYRFKIRRLIYKLIFYKLATIDYTFFSIFEIQNEKTIKNNYYFFKRHLTEKNIVEKVYFIGQPLIEFNIMSKENYKNKLRKIIDFYKSKSFLYILHRNQKQEIIEELASELNFEYILFDNLIELEMIDSVDIPSDFATFYSTAIITLPNFLKEANYRVFKSNDRYLNKGFIDTIEGAYKEFEKFDLKVELL